MGNINKTTKPLLSICIPTYNRADVLWHCLNSIVQNKSFNEEVEVFISDNASSDNTKEVIQPFVNKFNNIIYVQQKENIGGERNFIYVLENANGIFRKLHNDYSIFTENGLQTLLDHIKKEKTNKNLLYFINSSDTYKETINNLNDFIDIVKLSASWIGSYGFWDEDYINLEKKDDKIATQFMQVDWFLRLFERKKKCMICYGNYIVRYKFKASQGGYNFIKVQHKNYIEMFIPYYQKGMIDLNKIKKLKRDSYNWLLNWIWDLRIKKNKEFSYTTDKGIEILFKSCGSYYWFYTDPIKKVVKHLIYTSTKLFKKS